MPNGKESDKNYFNVFYASNGGTTPPYSEGVSMVSVTDGIFPPDISLRSLLPDDVSVDDFQSEIEAFLQKKTAEVRSSDHPVLINMAGLPASGKTYRSKKLKTDRPDLLYIGFDEIMESLSEYQKDFASDPKKAFERWELPARWTGYELLNRAVKKRLPVLFEHSNANPKHLNLYKNIIREGYSVEIRFIDAAPETVLPRLAKRERYFPPEQVIERWKTLRELLPEYKTAVSKFVLLKNETKRRRLPKKCLKNRYNAPWRAYRHKPSSN